MIDQKWVGLLRCPFDGSRLRRAEGSVVDRVNQAISLGQARDVADQRVTEPIDGGLLSSRGDRLYPVRGGILTLIADEAILLPH